jgi:hypothetical protein
MPQRGMPEVLSVRAVIVKTRYRASPLGQGAKALLEHQGFDFPSAPEEVVDLPSDVSDLDSKDLMTMFAVFTAWADYAGAQVGLSVIAEREMERALDIAEAKAWQDMPKSSVTQGKAMIALDDSVIAAKDRLDEAYAYRRLVTDLAARYERDAAVLSRELTRRTSESAPKQTRRDRWAT